MNKNLLIIGAGVYGAVAMEIAQSLNCFDKIDFCDDGGSAACDAMQIVGSSDELERLAASYGYMMVAIGNPEVRRRLINRIGELPVKLAALVSPDAYIAPSAEIGAGSVIEPMAVVHTLAKIGKGCLVSAGAVVNHASVCEDFVHIDCNATVAGNTVVPTGTKIKSGDVYLGKDVIK